MPESATAEEFVRQTHLGPCRKMRTTSVQRTPQLQVYAPYATVTHLNMMYFFETYLKLRGYGRPDRSRLI